MGCSFKENLRSELLFQDISVKELAELTGIPKASINNYLNARESMPPADYACRIAKALHTTVEKLVGSNDMNESPERTEELRYLILLRKLSIKDKSAILQLLTSLTEH